ncbi:MAG: UdgX family uracil-DNA binding protein [Verrucomicrobia bacterium]|nr:UdgX family uracil-DNA binding protein [Verrucomicrobiota bacterium]
MFGNAGAGQEGTPVNLEAARAAAARCRNCDLWERATQTVFGEGPATAEVILVGEQPGDYEDVKGRPFVGPAGKLLDEALVQAKLDRSRTYVTNAVKHFKWEPLGKRRLHKKPNAREMEACRPWLLTEIQAIQPKVLVCLGATAAATLFGKEVKVSTHRGRFFKSRYAPHNLVTIHPSAILRVTDRQSKDAEFARLVQELAMVAERLAES